MGTAGITVHREPWNKGKIVGQKAPFKLKNIWALRVRLQMEARVRELALFNQLGLDRAEYGTHSMRRTKATLIYRRTKNLRAVQLLLGHTKLESTVRYLGIEVDDALEISEQARASPTASGSAR